jgi:hypothetical protein
VIQLDVNLVFETAGGPKGLLWLLGHYCPDGAPPYPTVQMWRQRRNIPSRWLPSVLYALTCAGYPINTFLTDPDEFNREEMSA